MGRPTLWQRAHFRVLNDVPPTNAGYKYFECIHCSRAYSEDPIRMARPKEILDKAENFRRHLAICEHFKNTVAVNQNVGPMTPNPETNTGAQGNQPSGRDSRRRLNGVAVRLFPTPSRGSPVRSPRRSAQLRSPRFSKKEKARLERLLVEVQCSLHLPDMFVENLAVKRLFDFLRPGVVAYLPGRRTLGTRILSEHAAYCATQDTNALKKKQEVTGGRVNMLSDVWQNVSREHLLGTQLALFGSVLTYALPPVGGRHDGVAIAEQMEVLMRQAQSEGWKIGAIVTDNAGQCGRARRILALRWPQVVFLFCFAHAINNIVKSVLKTSFRDVAAQAASVVNTLNASSSKWLYFARDMMKSFYGKHLGLFTFCETRWNSMQSCFASILRVRTSLQALATKYKQREDFPDSLQILNNSSFWDKLAEAEQAISPLAEASYRLQRDENTMADVVVSLRDIYRGFARNSTCGHELVKCVEDRWGQCEQPLFMLGLVLHPAFVKEAQPLFDKSTPVSGRAQFGRFAVYYYRRLVGEDFGTIRRDIRQWMDGEYTRTTADEFPGDVVGFWRTLQDEHLDSRLPQLAIAVLSVCVNTATCERLFSELGLIHTARRNRMSTEKAAKTQIICKHVRNHDRKVVTETGLVKRVTCPIERELVGAGRRYHRREEQHDPSLQSSGCPSPALQTPQRPADNEEDDDLLDDPGDRIDGEQVFSLWDEYLVDVFADEEVENDFRQMSGGTNSLNAAQTTAAIFEQDELAEIPQPLNMPFPSRNDPLFPLERSLDGIRSCKATLSMLFGSSFGNETQLV